jgi:hypothetical protein
VPGLFQNLLPFRQRPRAAILGEPAAAPHQRRRARDAGGQHGAAPELSLRSLPMWNLPKFDLLTATIACVG